MSNNCIIMPATSLANLPNDPALNQLLYLFHMEGADNGNVFTDEMGHAFTFGFTPRTTTAYAKFGSSSMKGYGSLRRAMTASEVFGQLDLTMEAWVYPVSWSDSINGLFNISNGYNSSNGFSVYVDSTGALVLWFSGGRRFTKASAIPLNKWSHVAVTRYNGTVYLWVNGSLMGSYPMGTFVSLTDTNMGIGYALAYENGASSGDIRNHYLDEVRVSRGVALYTGPFTPPTQPFTVPAN